MHTPSRALSPAVPHALSNLLSLFIFHATQNVGGCYYEVERPTTPIYHVHTPSRTLSPSLSFEPRHTLQNVGGCYYEVERPTTPTYHVHTPSHTLSLSPTCSLWPALSPLSCPLACHNLLSLPCPLSCSLSCSLSLSTLSVVEESFSFPPPWKKTMVRAYQAAWWTAMACGLVCTGLDTDTAHQFESAPHCAPLPAAALLPSLNNAMLIRYVHNKATLLRLTARTHRTAHARESEDINTRVKGQGQRTRGKQTGMGGTLRGVVRAFWIFHFYLFFFECITDALVTKFEISSCGCRTDYGQMVYEMSKSE